MNCPGCYSPKIIRFGKTKHGVQRYLCNDCRSTFVLDKSISSIKGNNEQKKAFIDSFLRGYSIADMEAETGIQASTIYYWRQRVLDHLIKEQESIPLSGQIQISGMFLDVSYKGGSDLPRQPRRRGNRNSKNSDDQLYIINAVDSCDNNMSVVACVGLPNAKLISKALKDKIQQDSVLICDNPNLYKRLCNEQELVLETIPGNSGISLDDVHDYQIRLTRFLRTFSGVSSKHLNKYLVWFSFIDRKDLSKQAKKDHLLNILSFQMLATYKQISSISILPGFNKAPNINDEIWTPDHIADLILDDVGYIPGSILDKKIMEPSAGNGAILINIIRRLLKECKDNGLNKQETIDQIENNVYAIEIRKRNYDAALQRIRQYLSDNGIDQEMDLKMYNQNTLDWRKFGMFDYVVGNPPYIRVHALSESIKQKTKNFSFAFGYTDMYVIFFELGLKMLNETGKLAYITPSTFLKNFSQGKFRKHLLDNNIISKVEYFGSRKVFESIETYTCITVLDKDKKDNALVINNLEDEQNTYSISYDIDSLKDGDGHFSENPWIMASSEQSEVLSVTFDGKRQLSEIATVRRGIATNKDSVYIAETIKETNDPAIVLFHGSEIERDIIKPIVKGSKYHGGDHYYILFPYVKDLNGNYNVMKEDFLKTRFPLAYKYLISHKASLQDRDMNPDYSWFQFARNQGFKNADQPKLVISHFIAPEQKKLEVYELPKDTLVYSGIYITADDKDQLNHIKEMLETDDFLQYARLSGKAIQSGYISINSETIKQYRI